MTCSIPHSRHCPAARSHTMIPPWRELQCQKHTVPIVLLTSRSKKRHDSILLESKYNEPKLFLCLFTHRLHTLQDLRRQGCDAQKELIIPARGPLPSPYQTSIPSSFSNYSLFGESFEATVGRENSTALSTHGPAGTKSKEPPHGYIRQQGQQRRKNKRNQFPTPLRCLSEPIVKPAPFELTASKILWELICKGSVVLKHKAKRTKADHISTLNNWLLSHCLQYSWAVKSDSRPCSSGEEKTELPNLRFVSHTSERKRKQRWNPIQLSCSSLV